jgi:hypothetical protein
MDIDPLLAGLGESLGLGALRLDEFGLCQLVFDRELTVDIQVPQGGEALFLTAAVCAAPEGERSAPFLRTLLEANLLGQGTGNGYIALDPTLGEVVLVRRLEPELTDVARLRHELELFVELLAAWRKRVSGADAPSAPSPGQAAAEEVSFRHEGLIRA